MNRETPSFPDRAAEKHLRVALGAERFALLPFRFPGLSIIVAVILAIVAVLGIQRIQIDDALGQLFRSDTPEFKLYQQVTHEFPSSEYDVLVVVEGKSLLERDSVEKLRQLVIDLQLVDGARGIISLFSAREPPPPRGGLATTTFS
jgi:uncharacterized protein